MTEYDRGYDDGFRAYARVLKEMKADELEARIKCDKARLHEIRIELNRLDRGKNRE